MYMAKHRTQLYLDEEQRRVLEERARQTGKSMGELIREAVDEVYRKWSAPSLPLSSDDPLRSFVGAGESGRVDISARHDDFLYGPSLEPESNG
jgi:hypothetical protein